MIIYSAFYTTLYIINSFKYVLSLSTLIQN